MPTHTDLVLQAKQDQILRLKQSQQFSKQLILTIIQLNRANSIDLNIIDKITTIHELNDQIDKQLNNDFAINFKELKVYQLQLMKLIDKLNKCLHKSTNLIDDLQSRAELIDQDLRILETTLRFVKDRT